MNRLGAGNVDVGGTHGVSSGSLWGAGGGRWSWKGKQSLQDAEYSRTTKELIF